MAEIVNLRQARKAKARAEKELAADSNRAKFGRTKSEKDRAKKVAALERDKLDAHKRDSD